MLDTDVLVAALRSDRGASRVLLTLALENRYPVLASVPLLLQYESVLTRPEHLDAAEISAADVAVILDAIAAVAEPIRISYLWRPMLIDPGENGSLQPGARFAVYRDLHKPGLPLASVGEGVVVSVGKSMVLTRITRSRDAIVTGDYVVPRK